MKKLFASLTVSSVLALFALPVIGASAAASPCGPPTPGQTYTCTMHLRDAPPQTGPVAATACPDGTSVPAGILITTVENGIFHITINKAGDEWDTGTVEGSFTFTGADTNIVYTGHFSQWFGDSFNNRNMVQHATINFVGSSLTGDHIALHIEFHLSVSASGNVQMFFKTHC
jgi:hypothetical protein